MASELSLPRRSTELSPQQSRQLARQLAKMDDVAELVEWAQEGAVRIHKHAIWRVARTLRSAERRRNLRSFKNTLSEEEYTGRVQAYLEAVLVSVAEADAHILMQLEECVEMIAGENSLDTPLRQVLTDGVGKGER